MTRIDLQSDIHDKLLDKDIKGFAHSVDYNYLTRNAKLATIKKGMEFRPDKVAEYYLGSSENAWMISFANNFKNGILDYRLGREILIPEI